MSKTVKRAVKQTTITACKITFVNGQMTQTDLSPVQTLETVTDKNAEKLYRKLSGIPKNEKIFITSFDSTEIVFAMSLDDFMKYGKVVDDNTVNAAEYLAD